MATVEIQIPNTFYEGLDTLITRAEVAADAAEAALSMSSRLVSDGSEMYMTLTEELRQQRELLGDLRNRLHDVGNAINGKLGAKEAELFIRQIVREELTR